MVSLNFSQPQLPKNRLGSYSLLLVVVLVLLVMVVGFKPVQASRVDG